MLYSDLVLCEGGSIAGLIVKRNIRYGVMATYKKNIPNFLVEESEELVSLTTGEGDGPRRYMLVFITFSNVRF